MYFIGYDIGSSFIKASLLEANSNQIVCSVSYPEIEMEISAPQSGWAEQDPNLWWTNLVKATQLLLEKSKVNPKEILAIGVAYQMHGLVVVDRNNSPLRPAIIWCDSRAIAMGKKITDAIGSKECLELHLNEPGNFTASKLAWVKTNEPGIFQQIASGQHRSSG